MSPTAVNAVISNLIGAADGIAFVALITAIIIPFIYRKGELGGSSLNIFLCTLLTYFLIAAFNLGQSSGLGKANPALISTLYLAGAILFVFYFYAYERNSAIAMLRDGIAGHQTAASALYSQIEELCTYINSFPYPVLALNAEGQAVFNNRAFREAFLSDKHWEAGLAGKLEDLPTSVQSLITRCPIQEVSAMGGIVSRTLSLPELGHNGRSYLIHAIPVSSADGVLNCVVYVMREVSQELVLIKALEAEGKAVAQGAHLAAFTHELRNILSGISGIAQLLHGDSATSGEVRDYMEQIIGQAERANVHFDEYSGNVSAVVGVTELDLRRLLADNAAMMEETLPDGIKLRLALPETEILVEGNAADLLQAVVSLVTNAGEASLPGGTVIVTLGFAGMETDSQRIAQVTVLDSGRGISADSPERIFEPFYTTKGGHSGIGLMIARSIARKHGGSLNLRKSDELGTEFSLSLPMVK